MADGSVGAAVPVSPLADEVATLGVTLGSNLRRLRTRRGLSLERLAKLSGVSRAMLGQVETGKSMPTIAVLWKVTTALGVPFASLLAHDPAGGTVVLRHDQARILSNSGGRFTSRALFPFGLERRAEFYELHLAACHREVAEAHACGTRENLVVVTGRVEITVGREAPQVLGEGDAIQFEADVPHVYRNLDDRPACLYLVMTYIEASGQN